MKVGDWVVRKKEYLGGTWTRDHPKTSLNAFQIEYINELGTVQLKHDEAVFTAWAIDYFEPADQIIFNNLIDAYYDEGSKD